MNNENLTLELISHLAAKNEEIHSAAHHEMLRVYDDSGKLLGNATRLLCHRLGLLPEGRQAEILEVIEEVVEDLDSHTDEDPRSEEAKQPASKKNGASEKGSASNTAKETSPVLLLQAQSAVDQAACVLLADVLRKRGVTPSVVPYEQTRRAASSTALQTDARIICISSFEGSQSGALPVRYLIRRWRRERPNARFLACFWQTEQDAGN